MLLDRGVDVGEGADSAGDGAGGDLSPCCHKTRPVAGHFGVKAGEGQAHRGRLGVDAVAAPDANGVLMLHRAGFQRGQNPVKADQQQVGRPHQLHVEGGVQHVG